MTEIIQIRGQKFPCKHENLSGIDVSNGTENLRYIDWYCTRCRSLIKVEPINYQSEIYAYESNIKLDEINRLNNEVIDKTFCPLCKTCCNVESIKHDIIFYFCPNCKVIFRDPKTLIDIFMAIYKDIDIAKKKYDKHIKDEREMFFRYLLIGGKY